MSSAVFILLQLKNGEILDRSIPAPFKKYSAFMQESAATFIDGMNFHISQTVKIHKHTFQYFLYILIYL